MVKRFQEAYAEATYQLLNNKDKATAVSGEVAAAGKSQGDRGDLSVHRDQLFFPDVVSRRRGLAQHLDTVARSEIRKIDVNLAKYVDESTLDELKKRGSSSASLESDSRSGRSRRRRFSCQPKFSTRRSSVKTLCEKRKFYEAIFGMKRSKPGSEEEQKAIRNNYAVSISDGYVGVTVIGRKPGYIPGLHHFGVDVDDVDEAMSRIKKNYPEVAVLKRPSTVPLRLTAPTIPKEIISTSRRKACRTAAMFMCNNSVNSRGAYITSNCGS